jgi:hypothetical protein
LADRNEEFGEYAIFVKSSIRCEETMGAVLVDVTPKRRIYEGKNFLAIVCRIIVVERRCG